LRRQAAAPGSASTLSIAMSVHDKDTVDQCGQTNDGTVHLVMFCPGALGQDYSFEDVAEKAESYLEFALEGALEQQAPQFAGKPLAILVSCEYWPHSSYKPRFAKMARQLAGYEIGLLVEVSNLRVSGGTYDYLDYPADELKAPNVSDA
jgi:hypothetical protein